jgi:23S rRNA (adenine2503-C2)-methyltransferase
MTPTAPITQDVLTLPRKLPEGKVNLVGLTREGLRAALIAHGTPERQAKMRVNQIWQWIYQWGVRDFAAMSNLAKGYRADLAERFVTRSRWSISPRRIAARCAFPRRWAAR